MKNSKLKAVVGISLALLCIPQAAFANVVWPSIYIAEGLRSWYVILGGLVAETVFIKLFTNKTLGKAFMIAFVINTISTLVGVLLIPLVGFFGAIGIGALADLISPGLGATFDTFMWICEYILTVLTNVAVEGLAAKLIFKISFRKSFWWLLAGNAISVVICILAYGFTLRELIH